MAGCCPAAIGRLAGCARPISASAFATTAAALATASTTTFSAALRTTFAHSFFFPLFCFCFADNPEMVGVIFTTSRENASPATTSA